MLGGTVELFAYRKALFNYGNIYNILEDNALVLFCIFPSFNHCLIFSCFQLFCVTVLLRAFIVLMMSMTFRFRDSIDEMRRSLEAKENALEGLQQSIFEKDQVLVL